MKVRISFPTIYSGSHIITDRINNEVIGSVGEILGLELEPESDRDREMVSLLRVAQEQYGHEFPSQISSTK